MHKRLVITAIAVSFGAARLASAAAVEFAAAGFDPSAIQSSVDGFRAALGANNGIGGTFPDGRREINWDGVPDAVAAPNRMPANFFNANSKRGVVFFTPQGPLRGADAIRPLFQAMIAEFAKPGATFSMKKQLVEGDYAYIVWTAETADNVYELGTDTFVVRDGKIVAQSFTGKITSKT